MNTFRSDNNAGLCPEALQAIADANIGHQPGYGEDEWTARSLATFRAIFGEGCEVFFVATGTAANTLALAALTEPWQRIVCHQHSHISDDESTAPERLAQCRVVPIQTAAPTLTGDDILRAVSHGRGDIHEPKPGVISLANPTEFGTIYTPAALREICRTAHDLGYRVHVDGARFANAVATLGCDPRAITVDAGVDALSFGGTKNGLAVGEAVIFFPQAATYDWFTRAVRTFPFHRKSTGHLLSKHRFVSAPFDAVLRTGAWLRHAGHANAMAARLAGGLIDLGYELPYPTQANAVFVRLSRHADAHLRDRGHAYYPFGGQGLVRLMCSFDTSAAEVDALLADAEEVSPDLRVASA